MTQELFISVENGAARIAQIEDGRLTRLEAAPMGKSFAAADRLTNAIYLGQVERVVPRLQAAFVDIGLDRAGFLARGRRACWCRMLTATRRLRIAWPMATLCWCRSPPACW